CARIPKDLARGRAARRSLRAVLGFHRHGLSDESPRSLGSDALPDRGRRGGGVSPAIHRRAVAPARRAVARPARRARIRRSRSVHLLRAVQSKCVGPDVYVIPGERPGAAIGCWKTWEMERPPSFALEIVSSDRDKDYERSPAR